MIPPREAEKADLKAGELDATHPIDRVGYGPVPRRMVRAMAGKIRARVQAVIRPDEGMPMVRVDPKGGRDE